MCRPCTAVLALVAPADRTQLPYGFINLIQVVVHMTCFANTIYCGIHLGNAYDLMRQTAPADAARVLIPLTIIRILRIVLIPVLLDGMLLIGRIVALPMGTDADDFRAGAHLEALEDACLCHGVSASRGQGPLRANARRGRPMLLPLPRLLMPVAD